MSELGSRPDFDFVAANHAKPTFKPCPHKGECPVAKAFKEYRFSLDGLEHMQSFSHPTGPCRYGRDCRAHVRLCNGEWRTDDLCHCATYKHGRPGLAQWGGASALSAEDRLEKLQDSATAGGQMMSFQDLDEEACRLEAEGPDLILGELREHGFIGVDDQSWMLEDVKRRHHMCDKGCCTVKTLNWKKMESAQKSTPAIYKMNVSGWGTAPVPGCPKISDYAQLKKRPLLDVEVFAGLLYTGTDCQGLIRKALRQPASQNREAMSWKWTLTAIKHLVIKLAEDPPPVLYHGLNNVRPPSLDTLYEGSWAGYNNLVSGSEDLDVGRKFALGEGGTVSEGATQGLLLHMNLEHSHFSSYTDDEPRKAAVICANMQYLSKFADEKEWLQIPCNGHAGLALGRARSEPISGGRGGELIHQEVIWSCEPMHYRTMDALAGLQKNAWAGRPCKFGQ